MPVPDRFPFIKLAERKIESLGEFAAVALCVKQAFEGAAGLAKPSERMSENGFSL